MQSPTHSTASIRTRAYSGAAMLVFVLAIVLVPVSAALSLCAMHCCAGHESMVAMTGPAPDCRTDCAVAAAVAAPGSSPVLVTNGGSEDLLYAPLPALSLPGQPSVTIDSHALDWLGHSRSSPEHPLHVLNSTFRI